MNRSRLARIAWVVALLPRNACVVVLRAYRAVISPLYGNVCRYHPSCSRYALEAIQQYGVVRGTAMGAWRIVRCNPWAAGGIDDVRERRRPYTVNRFGFVTGPADEPTPTPQHQQPAIAPLLLPQRTRKA
ncbi:membrane protein insertion efficiency factor YidD [uncultured Microbacterium sp.]|uniref:membrane protein insertion efficiency factor YidD n=1 Tax=uncultured Microbacterium sp. TaxID=191216 RepID=UPI0025F5CE71|nr:membrane protein insertion efficiency factor YidD [uncultured Microbacterium sp.]